jgi:oxygen-independent coproporphyrinogen-3 oxidase
MSLGLYLHVPFCASICTYCNFNRGLLDEALKRRYVAALEREIRSVAAALDAGRHPGVPRTLTDAVDEPRRADTIYFGGGTPSILEPSEIGRLVEACRDAFVVDRDAEVTLETNPETVTPGRMAAFRAGGINRVSLGVQSFDEGELRRLGRVHDVARARDAFACTRAAGIDNVSLDLMMWLPQQTLAGWMTSLAALVDLRPAHASLYLLELYPNAPLREDMARAGWSQAPDEEAADMYLAAIDRLTAGGYEHYEISNFAKPGHRSRHNLKYWTDGEWLGLGCGAHSTLDGVRWQHISATADYVSRIEAGEPVATGVRVLTAGERLEEALFMGLRLVEGVDLHEVKRRYAIDAWECYGDRLALCADAGLVVHQNGRLRLTPRGLLLSNEVMAVFIDPTVR